mgnify:FL=1
MREAIRRNQTQSDAIIVGQAHLMREAIRRNQTQSDAIIGGQAHLMREAIRRNQTQSDGIRRNHRRPGAPAKSGRHSRLISSHQPAIMKLLIIHKARTTMNFSLRNNQSQSELISGARDSQARG